MASAAQTIPASATRGACLRAALLGAAVQGVIFFLGLCFMFGDPAPRALRMSLMFATLVACVRVPWARGRLPGAYGTWQGWVIGVLAMFGIGILATVLGVPKT